MAQGLSLLKEHYIKETARRFQEAGISALVYDHGGYGSSGAATPPPDRPAPAG
jgi:alpha-beta hydrolase superfamily lysophospholipase